MEDCQMEDWLAGSTQQHWPFPQNRLMAGYAYLFTHPGVPTVMHEHVYSMGMADKLKNLAEIRRRNGINSKSKVKILKAEDDMCAAVATLISTAEHCTTLLHAQTTCAVRPSHCGPTLVATERLLLSLRRRRSTHCSSGCFACSLESLLTPGLLQICGMH
jgi:hypothetical protein